jgi:hypothetical protein
MIRNTYSELLYKNYLQLFGLKTYKYIIFIILNQYGTQGRQAGITLDEILSSLISWVNPYYCNRIKRLYNLN